jgi:hypothetical protein
MAATQLTGVNIAAPGFYGLNTQDASTALPPSFAIQADNCVIDSYGRIGARKGWSPVNAVNATLGSNAVSALHEYVKNDGTTVQLSIGNKNIFTGTSTLVSVYNDATWTANNWKVVNFNNKAYFFQRGHDPLYYDGTTLAKLSAHAGYTGTVPTANEVLSAYGRLWVADTSTDKVTVTWSDTLAGHLWTAGASGTLNLHSVFTNGTDEIVALAAFNGFLVILCKFCVVIYEGANNPATMALYDVIDGIGCISRDTVQDIGSDLLFLSNRGLVSLGRLIQEKSAPINDLSKNVRDSLMQYVNALSDLETIKSVYNPKDSFYLLSLPYHDTVFCFDLRLKLDDGALRTTTWSGQTPTAFCVTRAGDMYMGKPGYIGKYNTYTDNGSTYTMTYFTNHMDGGSQTVLKFLKKMSVVIVGGGGARLRMKWIMDYNYQTIGSMTTNSIPAAAEYNISEYNIAEWNAGNIQRLSQQLGGSGNTFQIGVEVIVNGGSISIQQLDCFFKLGRVR